MLVGSLGGGSSPSATSSWVGWRGCADTFTTATTSNTSFGGTKPIVITAVRAYVAGSDSAGNAVSGRQVRFEIDSRVTSYFTAANNSSAQLTSYVSLTTAYSSNNGGASIYFRMKNDATDNYIKYGKGGSGTIIAIDASNNSTATLTTSDGLVGQYYYAGVPSAPTSIGVSQGTISGSTVPLTVSWSAPSSDGGDPVTGYIVDYGTSTSYGNTIVVSGTSTTISSLTVGTTYYFRVRAKNVVYDRTSNNNYTSIDVTTTYTPTNPSVTVGNYVGQNKATASVSISGLGLVPVINNVYVGSNSTNNNLVQSQDPANGSVVAPGSSVILNAYSYVSFGQRFDENSSSMTPIITNAKRFNGSTWVNLTTRKRWNGTSWSDITNGNV